MPFFVFNYRHQLRFCPSIWHSESVRQFWAILRPASANVVRRVAPWICFCSTFFALFNLSTFSSIDVVLYRPPRPACSIFPHILDSVYSKDNPHCSRFSRPFRLPAWPSWVCQYPMLWWVYRVPYARAFLGVPRILCSWFLFWVCRYPMLRWVYRIPNARALFRNFLAKQSISIFFLLPKTLRCRGVWSPPSNLNSISNSLFAFAPQPPSVSPPPFQTQSSALLFINTSLLFHSSFSNIVKWHGNSGLVS
jgi:hypothetical protein